MQQAGARPVEARSYVEANDVMVIPAFNTNLLGVPLDHVRPLEEIRPADESWLQTMNPTDQASFYSASIAPLPYSMGMAQVMPYYVFEVVRPLQYDLKIASETGTAAGVP